MGGVVGEIDPSMTQKGTVSLTPTLSRGLLAT